MPDDEAKTCAHQLLQSIDNLETALREYNAIKTK
jgi:molecular chaperone GrpE (heat shock protein)